MQNKTVLEHSLKANPINNEKPFIIYSTGPMWKLKCTFISYKKYYLKKRHIFKYITLHPFRSQKKVALGSVPPEKLMFFTTFLLPTI